jgi:hypothetical protein
VVPTRLRATDDEAVLLEAVGGHLTRLRSALARLQVTRRHASAALFAALIVPVLTACALGDGEGPRYTGRATSVSPQQICVGPNTSSRTETCGDVPAGFTDLPRVGQCVSLFAHFSDQGRHRTWTETSLQLEVDDSECREST